MNNDERPECLLRQTDVGQSDQPGTTDQAAPSDRPGSTQPKSAQRAAPDTRRAILDAAIALFLEHGYENFSLRQVAREIGYTPTTIYLYFEGKDDLLYHVAMEGFKHFGERLQEGYEAGETPLERFGGIGRAYVRFGLENPLHYRLMFMDRGEFLQRTPPPGLEKPIDSFAILVRVIAECMEEGLFKQGDPEVHAMAIWASVHGLVALAITTPYVDSTRVSAIEEVAYDMMVNGLRA